MKKNEIYSNKQVAEIIGLTQRQVLSWSEKGLIDAFIEPTGYGTKRGYSYTNLLEFGLCKTFFFLGFGFRAVKGIFNRFKEGNMVENWATNFKKYHDEFFKENLNRLNKQIEEYESKRLEVESLKEFKKNHMQKPIYPERPIGILVYFVGEHKSDLSILPWDMAHAINLKIFQEGLLEYRNCFLVDLGKIREEIESKI